MPFTFLLQRMRRNARDMILLGAAVSLVAGFFAFAPLYLRSVGESGLRYALDHARPGAVDMRIQSDARIDLANRSIVTDTLGGIVRQVETTAQSGAVFCFPVNVRNECYGDDQFRGYLPVEFERLTERFSVAEGRYPDVLGEAAVTSEVARQAHLALGDSLAINRDSPNPLRLTIVGILDPVNAADAFWLLHTPTLRGTRTDVNENIQRYDFGIIMPEALFDQQIAPITSNGIVYTWAITTEPSAMRAASLDDLAARIREVGEGLRLREQSAQVLGGLPILIQTTQDAIAAAEGTVILFASGVLLLMLYQLTAISALVLETQTSEWASIGSRGGSAGQLVRAQLATMFVLGVVAASVGLGLAYALLAFIGSAGPLAAVVGAQRVDLPLISVLLSLSAAALAVAAMTLPALPAARRGILALKGAISRPSTQPVWARYSLDFGLLALGVVLLLRLYFLTGGDDPASLLTDPGKLIRLITAAGAQDAGLLRDPFNLIAAGLLVIGLGMLWLRLFPLIFRGVSALSERLNSLLTPLAFWNVARDPSHYAQLVLVLIVTLGIGTASLALAATHDAGAYAVARYDTGADVRLTFAAAPTLPPDLPGISAGVTGSQALARYTTVEQQGERTTTVIGIDPADFAQAGDSSDAARAAAALAEVDPLPFPGLTLPDGAASIGVQLYAEPLESGQPIHTRIALDVEDAIGIRYTLPMSTPDDTLLRAFTPYRADLPVDAYPPLRLTGLRFLSRIDLTSGFQQTVFLDDLTAFMGDGSEQLLDDFERTTMPEWTQANQRGANSGSVFFVTPTQSQAFTGAYSLRVDYQIFQRGAILIEPVLVDYPVGSDQRLAVVLSTSAADILGKRPDAVRRPFRVGDDGALTLKLAQGNLTVPMRVVGVISTFPTAQPGDFFAIARDTDLLRALNQISKPSAPYILNERWLTTSTREPSPALLTALNALSYDEAALGEAALGGATLGAAEAGGASTVLAWDRYNTLLRAPLPNAIAGVLLAGFWTALVLGLLDFAFYLAMTARRRASSFAVLRALGWRAGRVWGMLTLEQAALVTPALVIGVALGGLLALLLLPFLALIGDETLRFPLGQIGGLLAALAVGFALLLAWAAYSLRRMSVNQMLRMDE